MFKHQGKRRTLKHNLHLAIILSFVAGIVNVSGLLSFSELTTHVTGHFSLFMNDVSNFHLGQATIYFLYIFSFLIGSFSSSVLILKFKENKKLNVFVLPTLLECAILVVVALLSNVSQISFPDVMVCMLLFAMGLQNSFVTKISNAVVRTTHLTGMFTDLGIELSQLCFPKSQRNKQLLHSTIKLRLNIIGFFFLGGIVGGFLYVELKLNTLFFAVLILLISLFYDDIKLRLLKAKRKHFRSTNSSGRSSTPAKMGFYRKK